MVGEKQDRNERKDVNFDENKGNYDLGNKDGWRNCGGRVYI